ncbi:MAG: ribosomal L7Ae/L30e/S12e/Gadd45 family protein [Acetivibrionales bacterium]
MLEVLKDRKKTVGVKQSLKAVKEEKAEVVFIAKDADEKVISPLKSICQEKGIDIFYVDTMKQLGKACNIEVGASTVALLK